MLSLGLGTSCQRLLTWSGTARKLLVLRQGTGPWLISGVTCLYSGLEHMGANSQGLGMYGQCQGTEAKWPVWLRSLESTWLS